MSKSDVVIMDEICILKDDFAVRIAWKLVNVTEIREMKTEKKTVTRLVGSFADCVGQDYKWLAFKCETCINVRTCSV